MRLLTLVVTAIVATGTANASLVQVPEMDASAGVAAIALLGGIAALVRERTRRK